MELVAVPQGAVALPQRARRAPRNRSKTIVEVLAPKQQNKKARKRLRNKIKKQLRLKNMMNTASEQGFLGDSEQKQMVAKTSGLSRAELIAHSVANPLMTEPQRLADEFSANETAVANPFERIQAQWWTSSTPPTNPIVAPQALPCFVFRNAERAAIIYDANPAGTTWSYIFRGTDEASEVPQTSFAMDLRGGDRESLKLPYALPGTSSYQPHGKILLAGQCADKPKDRFFFFNGNETLTGSVIIPVGAGDTWDWDLCLDYWDSDAGLQENIGAVAAQTGTAGGTFNINTVLSSLTFWKGAGYYAFTTKFTYLNGGVIQPNSEFSVGFQDLTITSTGPCCGHRTIADYALNAASINGVRVQAAAVRYCNVAAMLSLEGQVSCYQVPQQQHWKDYLIQYDQISSAKGSQTFTVREGAYAFLKPTMPEDFDFQSFTRTVGSQITDSFYPLKEQSAFLVVYPVIKTEDGRSGFFEICHGVEYQTRDVWRNTAVAAADDNDFRLAKNLLKDIPQFYSNSLHIGQILHNLKSVATKGVRFVQKYGPSVIQGANVLASMLA